jgi:hypothetical protein
MEQTYETKNNKSHRLINLVGLIETSGARRVYVDQVHRWYCLGITETMNKKRIVVQENRFKYPCFERVERTQK